ncbi:hypothetical protein HCI99_13195 [Listeria booriae]|uniref:Uncharacterized protein n=1 Tax=Listeria booriae TaxID=1552123 RepID=A0A7X0XEL3_9LIST|nr:hypothetical protein [Listeria booriae]MBC1492773.1 hypothetical protein [Listeria booriae]
MHAAVGGGSNYSSMDVIALEKTDRFLEIGDLPEAFQYIIEEEATTFFLYPKLLKQFKEVIQRKQLHPFFDQLSKEEQQFIWAIYGPNRVFSNERLCEKLCITQEQRRKQVRIIRYRMYSFLTRND